MFIQKCFKSLDQIKSEFFNVFLKIFYLYSRLLIPTLIFLFLNGLFSKISIHKLTFLRTYCENNETVAVCRGFGLANRDDYLRVKFDPF